MQVIDVIYRAIREFSVDFEVEIAPSPDSVLYGPDAVIDSLGLVNLILAVEREVEDEFDQAITIADERALSMSQSPFRTIESLARYVENLLKESRSA